MPQRPVRNPSQYGPEAVEEDFSKGFPPGFIDNLPNFNFQGNLPGNFKLFLAYFRHEIENKCPEITLAIAADIAILYVPKPIMATKIQILLMSSFHSLLTVHFTILGVGINIICIGAFPFW